MLVECVQVVVWTDTWEAIVLALVKKDILAPIVHEYVPPTVDLAHVDTQTDRVAALQGGRVIIVPQMPSINQFLWDQLHRTIWL